MRAFLSLIGVMFPLLVAAPAQAASFDCSKATAADEMAVCRDGVTSALDSEMGGLFYAYDKVPMLMGSNGARHDDAEAFLAERAKCGADITCLRRAYTRRSWPAMPTSAPSSAASLPPGPTGRTCSPPISMATGSPTT
jgi:uncharacterized protein